MESDIVYVLLWPASKVIHLLSYLKESNPHQLALSALRELM